jgi:hypothetical protein
MRHIPLNPLLKKIFADADGKNIRKRLNKAHKKLAAMALADRHGHTEKNGPNKWKPLKTRLTNVLGKKCWYTEVELTGATLVMDHYRPVCAYWWLSYDAENYRVACPWANSREHNAEHGCAGGKGEQFPLLPPAIAATGKNRLRMERPVILDPCRKADCDLLAFQADGRPILNPDFIGDPIAAKRVEDSKILLNLDHPDFNSKREILCREIATDVKTYERLPEDPDLREQIREKLVRRLEPTAPYSTAARFYLQFHKHLDWVNEILDAVPAQFEIE